MSNLESIDSQLLSDNNLMLTPNTVIFMRQGAKWAAFLGVLGIVVSGLIVLSGIIMVVSGISIRRYGADYFTLMGIGYIFFGVLNLFPALFLYRYAVKAKKALNRLDNLQLEEALRNLKLTFKFMGILAIIVLGIYVLAIVFFLFMQLL